MKWPIENTDGTNEQENKKYIFGKKIWQPTNDPDLWHNHARYGAMLVVVQILNQIM